MNNKLLTIFIIGIIFLSVDLVYAVPPPCSPEELLETSDYAIEGYVVKVKCGEPYDSEECKPYPEELGIKLKIFKPELVSDCIATVEVTKNLKGNYNIGDKVDIPFVKLVQVCENGAHVIPGRPKKDFRLNSKIRYYNSVSCAYSNFEEIEEPPSRPEIEEPPSRPEVEKSNRIYYLIPFEIVILVFIIYWLLRRKK